MDKYRTLGKVQKSISIEFVENGYIVTTNSPITKIRNSEEVTVADPVTMVFNSNMYLVKYLEDQFLIHNKVKNIE